MDLQINHTLNNNNKHSCWETNKQQTNKLLVRIDEKPVSEPCDLHTIQPPLGEFEVQTQFQFSGCTTVISTHSG